MTLREYIDPGTFVARLLRQTVRDLRDLVQAAADAGAERPLGAGVTALTEWALAHEHAEFFHGVVFDQSISATERLVRAAEDAAEGLITLLESDREHRTALMSLERVVSEATMRLCYMLDSNQPPPRIALRILAVMVDSIEGNRRAGLAFGSAGNVDQIEGSITGLHEMLERFEVERTPHKTDRFTTINVRLEGLTENVQFNATEAFARYLPNTPWQWNVSSGAAHSRGWMLSTLVDTSREPALTSYEDVCLAVGLTMLEVADAIVNTATGHTGVDVEALRGAIHRRRFGMTQWRQPNDDGLPILSWREYRTARGVDHSWSTAPSATFLPRPRCWVRNRYRSRVLYLAGSGSTNREPMRR